MKGFFVFGTPAIVLALKQKKIEVIVDTGFTGQLMLPQNIIDDLHLEQVGVTDYLMASGEGNVTNVYKAKLAFLNKEKEVIILSTEADFSLAGMELFHDCKIVIERAKNKVEIE